MKRWMPWVAVLLAGAAIALILWLVPGNSTACCGPPGIASPSAVDVPSRPTDAVPLTVVSVWDGDTIRAIPHAASDALPTTDEVRIRLIGVDTPELSPDPECGALDARDALSEMLPVGSTVWASPDADPLDRYGRWLLYLWTDGDRFVNYELVLSGAGQAVVFAPNDLHFDLLLDAEADAQAQGAGQWGSCSRPG